jgi:hypothetical protein
MDREASDIESTRIFIAYCTPTAQQAARNTSANSGKKSRRPRKT